MVSNRSHVSHNYGKARGVYHSVEKAYEILWKRKTLRMIKGQVPHPVFVSYKQIILPNTYKIPKE